MYSTQIIADRINDEISHQNKNKTRMLKDLKYGINTISEMRKGKQISAIRLAEIADYLGCSVDYLLGRETSTVNVGRDNNGFIGNAEAPVSFGGSLSTQERDLLRIYRAAGGKKQVEIMNYMYDLEGEI